jgi:hypothetical protein
MKPIFALLFTLFAANAVAAPPGGMRPGLWETSVASDGAKPIVSRACITAAQLEDPKSQVPKMPNDGKVKCTQPDIKTSGATIEWKVACTGDVNMTGVGTMTAAPDSYSGQVNTVLVMGNQKINMRQTMTGRRVGDCTK